MEALVRSLFALIREGNLQGVGDLLKVNPSLAFCTDPSGATPVLYAVYCGRPDFARTLSALRATPNSIFESAALGDEKPLAASLGRSPELAGQFSPDGFTLLHLAAFFGHGAIVGLLLEKGADPNAVSRNEARLHPLNSAAAQRDHAKARQCAEFLLDRGADPNAAQRGGFTAAHSAASTGNLELLRLLKEKGAALSRKAEDGKTPLDIARERNQPAAIAFLQA
jgi:uncharacterized protein